MAAAEIILELVHLDGRREPHIIRGHHHLAAVEVLDLVALLEDVLAAHRLQLAAVGLRRQPEDEQRVELRQHLVGEQARLLVDHAQAEVELARLAHQAGEHVVAAVLLPTQETVGLLEHDEDRPDSPAGLLRLGRVMAEQLLRQQRRQRQLADRRHVLQLDEHHLAPLELAHHIAHHRLPALLDVELVLHVPADALDLADRRRLELLAGAGLQLVDEIGGIVLQHVAHPVVSQHGRQLVNGVELRLGECCAGGDVLRADLAVVQRQPAGVVGLGIGVVDGEAVLDPRVAGEVAVIFVVDVENQHPVVAVIDNRAGQHLHQIALARTGRAENADMLGYRLGAVNADRQFENAAAALQKTDLQVALHLGQQRGIGVAQAAHLAKEIGAGFGVEQAVLAVGIAKLLGHADLHGMVAAEVKLQLLLVLHLALAIDFVHQIAHIVDPRPPRLHLEVVRPDIEPVAALPFHNQDIAEIDILPRGNDKLDIGALGVNQPALVIAHAHAPFRCRGKCADTF